jgi:hypothetical protein
MRADHDGMLLVRADLCDRLDRLRSLALGQGGEIGETIEGIRFTAAAYGLAPVARLAEALRHAIAGAPDRTLAALYLDRLRDAIGCESLDDDAAESMLASVSVRFAG